jgi:hypothetical protein
MTKKDYELIAASVKRVIDTIEKTALPRTKAAQKQAAAFVGVELGLRLAQENPRFDQARFYTACGIDDVVAEAAVK